MKASGETEVLEMAQLAEKLPAGAKSIIAKKNRPCRGVEKAKQAVQGQGDEHTHIDSHRLAFDQTAQAC